MPIHITNSLTGKKEIFTPLTPGIVKMYVCGPTVYNYIHIGNARVYVFFDVVQRYLEYAGYKVTRVVNFTDVDDKIINRAVEEKTTCDSINDQYIKAFLEDMASLSVRRPEVEPRVTTHIAEIIGIIEGLIKNGKAYVQDNGEVLYSIRSFTEYGKLSGKKIDELLVGARVQKDEKKRDPLDFSLWKPQKSAQEPAWDSPWGKGRPGWHIECSAMAMKYLGETFDIHGGGRDLIHPHHENEIAQSEGFSNKPYVNYWMHNNLLTFNSEKMSKSLGNVLLTRDFIQTHSAEVLRYLLLSGQYRSTIEYSEQHLKEINSGLHRIYTALAKCENVLKAPAVASAPSSDENTLLKLSTEFKVSWNNAMDDDFNTAKVIGLVFEYVRKLNAYIDKKGFKTTENSHKIAKSFLDNISELSKVINLFAENPSVFLQQFKNRFLTQNNLTEVFIRELIKKRQEARASKNFAEADKIRNELQALGIEIKDRGTDTDWDVLLV